MAARRCASVAPRRKAAQLRSALTVGVVRRLVFFWACPWTRQSRACNPALGCLLIAIDRPQQLWNWERMFLRRLPARVPSDREGRGQDPQPRSNRQQPRPRARSDGLVSPPVRLPARRGRGLVVHQAPSSAALHLLGQCKWRQPVVWQRPSWPAELQRQQWGALWYKLETGRQRLALLPTHPRPVQGSLRGLGRLRRARGREIKRLLLPR